MNSSVSTGLTAMYKAKERMAYLLQITVPIKKNGGKNF